MESDCSLMGKDRRIDRTMPDHATRGTPQALYSTWDSRGIRIAWTGADWNNDGDLFIYLDTVSGGTLEIYNPYPDRGC